MEILRYILIVVEVLCCLMLIGVILLQQSKSQGMGLAFGGGMSESLFGSRAGNVLTKFTVILALVFLANTTLLGILYTTRQEGSLVDQAAPASAPVTAVTPPPAQESSLMTAPVETAPVAIPAAATEPMVVTEQPVEATVEAAPVLESAPAETAPAASEPVAP